MKHFVVFGEDWGAHPSSTQHLIKRVAKDEKVTWVNSVGMRKPSLKRQDMSRVAKKCILTIASQLKSKNESVETPLTTINLSILPWHDKRWVNEFNKKVTTKALGPKSVDEQRIYWVSVPTAITMIDKQPGDLIVYYCGDDFLALDGVDHLMLKPIEQQLIDQADLILVASETLKNKMPSDKTYVLSHGVDFELFSQVIEPDPLLEGKKNTIGFYGSICNWLDLSILEALAAQRPDYQLVMVGECKISISKLLSYPNVTHIGRVEHRNLPQFSQNWDVSILPFVNNKQIQSCDPLKLKEYLAAGTPIVSTRFNAVEKYQSIVHIADTSADFIRQIDQVLNLNDQQKRSLSLCSQASVAEHGWAQKTTDAMGFIDSLLLKVA